MALSGGRRLVVLEPQQFEAAGLQIGEGAPDPPSHWWWRRRAAAPGCSCPPHVDQEQNLVARQEGLLPRRRRQLALGGRHSKHRRPLRHRHHLDEHAGVVEERLGLRQQTAQRRRAQVLQTAVAFHNSSHREDSGRVLQVQLRAQPVDPHTEMFPWWDDNVARGVGPPYRHGMCQRRSICNVRLRGEVPAHDDHLVRVLDAPHVGRQGEQPRLRDAGVVDPHHGLVRDGGR